MDFLNEFEPVANPATFPKFDAERDQGLVKYNGDPVKYEIDVGRVLTWISSDPKVLQWRGRNVDHEVVQRYYRAKWSDPNYKKGSRETAVGMLQGAPSSEKRWYEALIWVVSTEKHRVFSHICKRDRFHHTSLAQSPEVFSAGAWFVKDGQPREMAALSGHYTPSLYQFMNGVSAMKEAVIAAQTSLFLWSHQGNQWATVPFDTWSKMSPEDFFATFRAHRNELRLSGPSTSWLSQRRSFDRDDLVYPQYPGAGSSTPGSPRQNRSADFYRYPRPGTGGGSADLYRYPRAGTDGSAALANYRTMGALVASGENLGSSSE